ncbi:MAG TPA: hypothetical protein VHN14_16395, partial [Kofleriaceae bacterium]|nr:hypothetical protein [Kofleriaceae bacterium]
MHHFLFHTWFEGLARRTWIVTALTVISCAAFAARAANSILAVTYLTTPEHGPRAAPPVTPTRPAEHPQRAHGRQLVERNMFCSSCAPAGAPGPANGFVLPPAVLIETSLGREPRATVHVLASEVQGSWGLGDTIPG